MAAITAFGDNAILALLKRRYGNVAQTIPLKIKLWPEMQSAPKYKFNGRDFLFPVIASPGGGFTFYPDGGKFPGAIKPSIPEAKVGITQAATLVSFSNLMMELGRTDEAGFLGNTDKMIKLAISNFLKHMNVSMYGLHPYVKSDGTALAAGDQSMNGVVNHITGVVGAPVTSMTVDRPLGYANADLGSTRYTKHLDEGDVLAYGTIAGNVFTVKGHLSVTGIARSTSTLTVSVLSSAGGQPAADDFLVWADVDTAGNNSYGRATTGLGALLYQQALTGVAQSIQDVPVTADNPRGWATQLVTSAGPFDQADWHQAKRTVDVVSNSGGVTLMISDPTMIDIYAATLFPDQRLAPQEAKGGMKNYPTFASGEGDLKQIYDNYCPYGLTYFVTKGEFFNMMTKEPTWQTAGGGQWKAIQGMDSVYAAFVAYLNHGYSTLNSHAVVKGITVANAPI